MCKPETAAPDERICRLEGMADLILSIGLTRQYPGMDLSHSIVANDVEFGPDGRIFLLTGPNQGGKTTYTRAIGVTQLLFQAGIFVPGRSGAISRGAAPAATGWCPPRRAPCRRGSASPART